MSVALAILALLLVVGTGVLWFRRIQGVQIPEDRTPFVLAWLGGAGLGVASLSLGEGVLAGIVAVLAILLGCFGCLTVAISRQRVDAGVIAVGRTLPPFQATDEHGESFDSAELAGKPVLLKFFRGHW